MKRPEEKKRIFSDFKKKSRENQKQEMPSRKAAAHSESK
jgi:hypothetical protein